MEKSSIDDDVNQLGAKKLVENCITKFEGKQKKGCNQSIYCIPHQQVHKPEPLIVYRNLNSDI
jgi:hypothetical protein